VSGQAKALGERDLGTEPLRQFLESGAISGRSIQLGWITLALAAAALVLVVRRRRDEPLGWLLGATLAALGAHIAYLSLQSGWNVWSWYFYLLPFALFLALTVLLGALWERVPGRMAALAPALVALVVVAPAAANRLSKTDGEGSPSTTFIAAAYDAGRWADGNLPPGAVVAMGDRAASFGYLTDHPVVQLEGLVESKQYLDALDGGRVHEFLRERRVGYLALSDHGTGLPPGEPLGRGCVRYLQPAFGNGPKAAFRVCSADRLYLRRLDGGQFYAIYRYRPAD
jgi:hypothetical protein